MMRGVLEGWRMEKGAKRLVASAVRGKFPKPAGVGYGVRRLGRTTGMSERGDCLGHRSRQKNGEEKVKKERDSQTAV